MTGASSASSGSTWSPSAKSGAAGATPTTTACSSNARAAHRLDSRWSWPKGTVPPTAFRPAAIRRTSRRGAAISASREGPLPPFHQSNLLGVVDLDARYAVHGLDGPRGADGLVSEMLGRIGDAFGLE